MKGRTGRLVAFGLIIIVLLVASRIVSFYVDWMFFEELGYENVFLKVFNTEVLYGTDLRRSLIYLRAGECASGWPGAIPSREHRLQQSDRCDAESGSAQPAFKPFGILLAAVIGIFGGMWGSSLWRQALVFLNAMETGTKDPISEQGCRLLPF